MGTSLLLKIHVNKGKIIAQTIIDRTDNADNPFKTWYSELKQVEKEVNRLQARIAKATVK